MIRSIVSTFHRFPRLILWIAVFAFTWTTAGEIGVVWDEPFFWEKEDRIGEWTLELMVGVKQRSQALSEPALKHYWPYCIGTPHENPPMWAILGEAGHALTGWLVGELHGRRLASAALFSGIAVGVFGIALRWWGAAAAWTALAAWVLHPRVFAHGRIGAIDMTMTAFWFFAASSFRLAVEGQCKPWRFGILWAFAIMSKFTAVIAGPANLAWAVVYRWLSRSDSRLSLRESCGENREPYEASFRGAKGDCPPPPCGRRIFLVLFFAATLTPLVMVAVHPGWWREPIGGISTAIEVHRHRHETQTVPTYYWGAVHPHSLPWHNTLVLTFYCTPIAWVVLASIGLAAFLMQRGRDSVMGWALINWSVMMIVRALPIAPGHDGIRQFLPAFPFFALIAGFGMAAVQTRLKKPWLTTFIVLAAVGLSARSIWNSWRAPLSYYSEEIGGLRGAQKLGLESTYWWECVTPKFLDEMNRVLPPSAVVGLSSHGNIQDVFDRYQKWGTLRSDFKVLSLDKYYSLRTDSIRGERPSHFLILNREGMLFRKDWPINERFLRMLKGDALATVELQGVRLLALVEAKTP